MPYDIRPTQEKVRKALFDILGDLTGLSFLELFAGSGAIGFEAVSRGAAELALVENSRSALRQINKNMEELKVQSCRLYPKESTAAIKRFHQDKRKFDVIFLDPPYHRQMAKKALQILGAYDILAPNGLIAVQHFKKESLPESEGDLILFRQSRYGDTVLSFYKKG
jgi:16S rRNA (guanine(966)-N(2))-methyltransferase RsmD